MSAFPHKRFGNLLNIQYRVHGNKRVSIVQENNQDSLEGKATSRNVTCCIVSDYDHQKAREQSQKRKKLGTTIREQLAKLKKHLTANKLTLEVRQYHLDKNVFENTLEKCEEQEFKRLRIGRNVN